MTNFQNQVNEAVSKTARILNEQEDGLGVACPYFCDFDDSVLIQGMELHLPGRVLRYALELAKHLPANAELSNNSPGDTIFLVVNTETSK